MSDKNNNVYLSKIENVLSNNLSKNTNDLSNYTQHANIQIRNDLSSSYNSLVNDKYKIKINQNTLERFKNNFR
jgi:peptidyl-prolyl cis-trans isomerase D